MKPISIRQRIARGYAWPLCIAFTGIGVGLLAGNHYTHQALKVQEAAIAERKLFDEVRIKILAHRPAKQFTPTLNDSAAFEAESKVLLNLLTDVSSISSQYRSLHNNTTNVHNRQDRESQNAETNSHTWNMDQSYASQARTEQRAHSDSGLSSVEEYPVGLRAESGSSKSLSIASAEAGHEELHVLFKELEAIVDSTKRRAQQFIDEVNTLGDRPDRQELARQSLLGFVQSPEYAELISFTEELATYSESVAVREQVAATAVQRAFWFQTTFTLGSLLLSIAIAALIAKRTSRAIAEPVVAVTKVAQQVTEDNNFELRAPIYSQDEVGCLANALNHLIEQVKQLLDEVNAKNTDLSNAYSRLEQQQIQLVQSEKMSSLGQLVAGIAHEINNPVNFIHGNIGHVREHVEDVMLAISELKVHMPEAITNLEGEYDLDFIQQDLGKILTSMYVGTERIRQIVLSLRNFSRLDEADYKAVCIHEGIDSSLMILQHRLKARPERPAITVNRHYGNLPKVECYPGQINQVTVNLLSNAIDALEERYFKAQTNSKDIPLEITMTTRTWGKDWIEIAIKDTGIGMTESVQERLFETFFTTKPEGVGTGIGMSISREIIVDTHHGELTFTSAPNKGTEFYIRIPITQALNKEQQVVMGKKPISVEKILLKGF